MAEDVEPKDYDGRMDMDPHEIECRAKAEGISATVALLNKLVIEAASLRMLCVLNVVEGKIEGVGHVELLSCTNYKEL